jgi:DNA-binding NarL/FixJ family response regulator
VNRIRVLVADDRPIFRAGVQGMLRDFPEIRIVGEAVSGRQAVERARQLDPDVILMDLNMPDMNGIAATRAIKAESPDRVILALTVSDAEEDVVEMIVAGASGYVLKDVDPLRLARSIEEAFSGQLTVDDSLLRRVIARLGQRIARREAPTGREPLTEREAEVLRLVCQGKANKAIATRLQLSEGTIKSHLRNIYRKLRVQTRAEAAAQAARLQL